MCLVAWCLVREVEHLELAAPFRGKEIKQEVGGMIDAALMREHIAKHAIEIDHFVKQLNLAFETMPFLDASTRLSKALALENEAASLRNTLFFECFIGTFRSQKCGSASQA